MRRLLAIAISVILGLAPSAASADVRLKDLGRFLGTRDNALVGYGVVTGLAGSGDSPRNEVTRQALMNVLTRLGVNVTADQIQSRNVAAVVVTGVLPPDSNVGDRIDVTVTSIGDARSLVGGALLMTPLMGPDQQVYALAQGGLVVGGYRFDSQQNVQQKNYPTSGVLPGGATIESPVRSELLSKNNQLTFILKDPDVTTAERIADAIDAALGAGAAQVRDASAVTIATNGPGPGLYRLISRAENVMVNPDALARVVINERSGTIVAGGGVQVSSIVIAQGDIRISVSVDDYAPVPALYPGITGGRKGRGGGRGLVITNTKLDVESAKDDAVVRFPNTTVADLAEGLSRLHVDTRGVIAILQAIKAAGALHADIIVQ